MNIVMVEFYKRLYGDKNIEMLLAKKMGIRVVTVDDLRKYDVLAGVVFDRNRVSRKKKVLLDNSMDARHKKFYLAYLISKMILDDKRKQYANVISQSSKLDDFTCDLAKVILGSTVEVDDIIEEHNPVIKPRQYIKLDMSKIENKESGNK